MFKFIGKFHHFYHHSYYSQIHVDSKFEFYEFKDEKVINKLIKKTE